MEADRRQNLGRTEGPPCPVRGPSKTFSTQELRTVFARMVRTELEGGSLRSRRTKQLLRFARDIGIGESEAETIVDDARHNASMSDPALLESIGRLERSPVSLRPAGLTGVLILGTIILLSEWVLIHLLAQ